MDGSKDAAAVSAHPRQRQHVEAQLTACASVIAAQQAAISAMRTELAQHSQPKKPPGTPPEARRATQSAQSEAQSETPPKPQQPAPTPQHPGEAEYLDVMDGDPAMMDPDMPHASDLAPGSFEMADTGAQNQPNVQPQPALTGSAPKVRSRALKLAERQLLGCLLHRPDLFGITLDDGHAFEEAIIPGDMTTDAANALYHVVYERIAAGDTLRLSSLLMELMEQGRQDLANLLTQADADIEKLNMTEPEQLEAVFRKAAEKLLEMRQIDEKLQTRDMALNADSAELQEHLLRQIQEQHRANPSPIRIAGLPRGKS